MTPRSIASTPEFDRGAAVEQINARQFADTQADASGQIKITGIPNAMSGSAELSFGPGRLAGEPLESLVARATFTGSKVSIENIDAKLAAGHIVASGNYDTTSKAFELQGRAEGVQLSRLFALTERPGLSNVSGTADFTAKVSGNLSDTDFSNYQITFDGEGKNVVINGREAGTLALVGRTENKQLNISLTTGLLGYHAPGGRGANQSHTENLPQTSNHFEQRGPERSAKDDPAAD